MDYRTATPSQKQAYADAQVAKGAEYLDQWHPGWETTLAPALDTLDVTNANICPLGIIGNGSYTRLLDDVKDRVPDAYYNGGMGFMGRSDIDKGYFRFAWSKAVMARTAKDEGQQFTPWSIAPEAAKELVTV